MSHSSTKSLQRAGKRPFGVHVFTCVERHVADGKLVGRKVVIDRLRDRYYERIVDWETGRELRCMDEPLSERI